MVTPSRGILIPVTIMCLGLGCAAALIAAVVLFFHPGVMAGGASAHGVASVTTSMPSGPPWTGGPSGTSGPPWT
jgi:hypothetical protein